MDTVSSTVREAINLREEKGLFISHSLSCHKVKDPNLNVNSSEHSQVERIVTDFMIRFT